MTPSLLHLCARATTFPGLTGKLIQACARVTNWDALLVQAETQGLGPLLHWHLQGLKTHCPDHFRRATRLLFLRHHHTNSTYAQVLREVLDLLQQASIEVLVLKGAALCQSVYPEIGLRPMRDIDLLLRKEQAQQAQTLLVQAGFTESNAPRPDDHFHLPSLHKKVGGMPVCIELHHALFPDCPPYYQKHDFDSLRRRAMTFDLLGAPAALTLGHEDMLWHVFQHGFRMPLTYEPFKLISAADIITLVEIRLEEIDWQRIKSDYPEVLAALPLFHHLTPWQDKVLSRFSWKATPVPTGVGEAFQGWPHLRLAEQREKSFLALLRDTFLPPEWWSKVYYGIEGRWAWYRCRWLTHPNHVFWWMRLYASFLGTSTDEYSVSEGQKGSGGILFTVIRLRKKLAALINKFR